MAYVTTATLRAMDGLADTTTFPDATLDEAVTWATTLIDRYTGTSWEHKTTDVRMDAPGSSPFYLYDEEKRPVIFPRSVVATLEGSSIDATGWTLLPEGLVITDAAVTSTERQSLAITVTAGATENPPADIAWAARTMARQYVLDLVSRVPDRALSVQNDFGTVPLAQAGGLGRPTSLPEVNAVLNRRRHRAGPAY